MTKDKGWHLPLSIVVCISKVPINNNKMKAYPNKNMNKE